LKRSSLKLFAAGLVGGVVVAPAAAAFASDTGNNEKVVYNSSDGTFFPIDLTNCVTAFSQFQWGDYGGYHYRARVARTRNTNVGLGGCDLGIDNPIGAGGVRVGGVLYKNGKACVTDPTIYSSTVTSSIQLVVGFNGSDLPCGNGQYTYKANSSTYMEGKWSGGSVTTNPSTYFYN